MAHFSIVGAGPGDVELLTLKAARAIGRADVVLYDRLVGEDILSLAPDHAEMIYVGKGSGEQEKGQEKIFELFVRFSSKTSAEANIVRLKGGDPMVFGRGVEEWLFLKELGCTVDLIPGLSSSLALPALLGIPLTARGSSQGFAVVTGHGLGGSEVEWAKYSSVDTLAILMGISRRESIAKRLIALGRNPKELVCFIQNGATKNQKIITSNLEGVAKGETVVSSPAVWIVGNVVSFYGKLHDQHVDTNSWKELESDKSLQENQYRTIETE